MKLISSRPSSPATRVSLTACAFVLGAAFAAAQTTSPSRDSSAGQSGTRESSRAPASAAATTTPAEITTGAHSGEAKTNPAPISSSAVTDPNTAGAMTGRETSAASGKLGFMDRRFVNKAADSGMSEVALAQLASERATNADVKSFAQQLVQDHTAVNSELTGIASQKSVKLDKEDGKDRFYKRLSNKSGAEFDQEFVAHMVDEHEDAVKLFEKASQDAKDADVRSFAAKHVDHLRTHLQKAQSLRASLVPTGRDSTANTSGYEADPTKVQGGANSQTGKNSNSNSNTDKASGSDRSGTYAEPRPSSSSTEPSSSSTTPKK